HVDANVRLGPDHFTEAQKLVGTKRIGFRLLPPEVVAFGPLLPRANPVHPMVIVCKTAARPPERGNLQGLQRFHHVKADAAIVWDVLSISDPNSRIDASSKVFSKLAVDKPLYLGASNVRMNADVNLIHL